MALTHGVYNSVEERDINEVHTKNVTTPQERYKIPRLPTEYSPWGSGVVLVGNRNKPELSFDPKRMSSSHGLQNFTEFAFHSFATVRRHCGTNRPF